LSSGRRYAVAISGRSEVQWREIKAPPVAIGEADGDGLRIRVVSLSVPMPNFSRLAMAEVTTINGGQASRHQNALISAHEVRHLADALRFALSSPDRDGTVSLFDDGMTLRIEGFGDRWTVTCRNVPSPPPGAKWSAFPEYSFEIGQQALRAAIAELGDLYMALAAM